MSGNGNGAAEFEKQSTVEMSTLSRPRRKLTEDEERAMDEAHSSRALVPMRPTMLAHHDFDPAEMIVTAVGDLSDFHVYGNLVLVGCYERPEKLSSGIILSDQTRREDEHQGKSALVLKKGPAAFVSDSNYDFRGQDVKIGDWISLWVSDGRKVKIRGQLCRLVEDMHIRMRIPAPDVVY